MAKCKSVSLVKKSSAKSAAKASGSVKADPGAFVIVDNQDNTCEVQGVDAAGNPVDITSVATLAVSSDNPTALTVDTPTGMTFKMSAPGPLGSANVVATATWNDGSIGPFSFTLPVEVVAGPAGGIKIVPGTPTSR